MALYDGAHYRAAHQGYAHFAAQAAQLVAVNSLADPSVQSSIVTPVGVCQFPGLDWAEGIRDLEGIGLSKDMAKLPGRREYTGRFNIEVADGTFLEYAIRNRTAPGTVGTIKGLQLLALEIGTDTLFGDGMARQCLDSLINTLQVTVAENQNVQAQVEVWPMVIIPQPTPQTAVLPDADVLIWSHLEWDIGGTDYHSLLSRVQLTVNNNLVRQGMRKQMAALGASEPWISRTPYYIGPSIEKITVSYGLHDQLPATLHDSSDWGTVTLRAEQPGTGAGRKYLQIVIDTSYINRFSQQNVPANQMLTFSTDVSAIGVSIGAGETI